MISFLEYLNERKVKENNHNIFYIPLKKFQGTKERKETVECLRYLLSYLYNDLDNFRIAKRDCNIQTIKDLFNLKSVDTGSIKVKRLVIDFILKQDLVSSFSKCLETKARDELYSGYCYIFVIDRCTDEYTFRSTTSPDELKTGSSIYLKLNVKQSEIKNNELRVDPDMVKLDTISFHHTTDKKL